MFSSVAERVQEIIAKLTVPQESAALQPLSVGHTSRFHPQTEKLKPLCTAK